MVGNKNLVVYWSCADIEALRSEEPLNIYKNFIKNETSKETNLVFCPGFKDYMNNIYGLKSIYDYSFKLENGSVLSNDYNQEFFNNHVEIRSIEHKVFSFKQRFIFFTEEDSLEMSVGITPFLEKNYLDNPYSVIPGTIDIGKWFRIIDFAFILNDNSNSFTIKENEIFQYIKFNTDKKIIFKYFNFDNSLIRHSNDYESAKNNRFLKLRKLEDYYKMSKNKNQIIQQIKNNLTE